MGQALELLKRLASVNCNLVIQNNDDVAHVIDFQDGSSAVLTHSKDMAICTQIADVLEAFPDATVRSYKLTNALEEIVQTAELFLAVDNSGPLLQDAVHDVCRAIIRASTNKAANIGPKQIDSLAKVFWTTMIRYQNPEAYDNSIDPQRAEAEWDSWEPGTMNKDAIRAGVGAVADWLTRVK